jgi:hypothetical protein
MKSTDTNINNIVIINTENSTIADGSAGMTLCGSAGMILDSYGSNVTFISKGMILDSYGSNVTFISKGMILDSGKMTFAGVDLGSAGITFCGSAGMTLGSGKMTLDSYGSNVTFSKILGKSIKVPQSKPSCKPVCDTIFPKDPDNDGGGCAMTVTDGKECAITVDTIGARVDFAMDFADCVVAA